MHKFNPYVFMITFLTLLPATAADFVVNSDETLADAIRSANANTSGKAYEIELQQSVTGTGNISKNVSITGTDSQTTLTGGLSFTGGRTFSSEIKNLTVTGGGIENSSMFTPSEAQNLTLENVIFSKNIDNNNQGGALVNSGVTAIHGGQFMENSAAGGGAIYNGGTLTIDAGTHFNTNKSSSAGGAIFNAGVLNISNAFFDGNVSGNTGGAINSSGDITINASSFSNNSADYAGGAIRTQQTREVKLTIYDTDFSQNKSGAYGGAIAVERGQIQISGGTFYENEATGQGGAASINGGAISNATFRNNKAQGGGAIRNQSGDLVISGVTMTANNGQDFVGGAIYNMGSLTVRDDSKFNNNTASQGGAIYSNSSTDIYDATFIGNIANSGHGGAVNANISNIINTEFTNNRADNGQGGGLYSTGTNSILSSVLFDGNNAQYGGGIMNNTTESMTIGGNSILRNNTAEAGGAIYNMGTLYLDTTAGDITFSGNTAAQGGADIYNNDSTTNQPVINITGNANKISMNGGIGGSGTINKTGTNRFVLQNGSDNSTFIGTFAQTGGITEVYTDKFFGGQNNISNGAEIYFAQAMNIGHISLSGGGIMYLYAPADAVTRAAFAPNKISVSNFNSDGTGVIMLRSDGTLSDSIALHGTATGNATLHITHTGATPTSEKINVVDTSGATSDNSTFQLSTGDTMDMGLWKYGLNKESDNNWYLNKTSELSSNARGLTGIPALHLSIIKAGTDEMNKHLGNLRSNNANDRPLGLWVRGFGKHLKIHETVDAKLNMFGIEAGVDWMVRAMNGRLYFGVMGGFMQSEDIDVHQAATYNADGTMRTPSVSVYAAWVHRSDSRSKWFANLTAHSFWIDTKLNNVDQSGNNLHYKVERNFITLGAETGKLFYFRAPEIFNVGTIQNSHMSLEPKIELQYARGAAADFNTSLGDTITVDTTNSLTTRLALKTNFLPNGTQSQWKPYMELGVYNEWLGKTELEFGGLVRTASDTKGLGIDVSLGANAEISENAYTYGSLTFETGKVYTSYKINIGVRAKF